MVILTQLFEVEIEYISQIGKCGRESRSRADTVKKEFDYLS